MCGLLWLVPGLLARAQDARSAPPLSAVVIVRVPGDETIISRLRAELSSYRFRPIELPDRPSRRTEALSQLAEQHEAQAALRAKPELLAIELWVRPQGASTSASEEQVNAGPARDPEVLALRVTEAMRARGLTLPPLAAAAGKTPAADGDGRRSRAPAEPPPDAEVGVAEPRTLQPGEITEPVAKPADSGKPASTKPAEPEPARPSVKPVEQTPARPESKPAAPKPDEEPQKQHAAESKPAEPKSAEAKQKSEQKQPAAGTERAETTSPEALEPSQVAAESDFQGARNALLYAEIGPAGVLSPGPGHLGPALDLLVSFTFRPYQTSSISLVGLIPLLATAVLNDGASIDVRTYGIGGFGDLHLPLGRVELSAGLGGLGLICTVLASDQGAAKYMAEQKTQRLGAVLGRVGASLVLTRDLRLSASLMAGLTVQQLQLKPAGAKMDRNIGSIATWGWPLLFGSLSIELALPWDR